MDFRSMIGWFGLLLAAACVMVALVAVFVGFTGGDARSGGSNDLMVPIAMLFLKPISFAAMAAGAVGLFWPAEFDPRSHNFRCWAALLTGVAAAVTSFMFGPAF